MTRTLVASAAIGLAVALGPQASGQAQDTASAQPEVSVGGLLASPRPAPAKSLDGELDAIAAQLGKLATGKAAQDAVVKRAIEQGKRAALQASRALAAGDGASATRKKAIARAALELARRAAARREETRAESAAAQSAVQAERAKAQAAVLLEQARAQWHSLSQESP